MCGIRDELSYTRQEVGRLFCARLEIVIDCGTSVEYCRQVNELVAVRSKKLLRTCMCGPDRTFLASFGFFAVVASKRTNLGDQLMSITYMTRAVLSI